MAQAITRRRKKLQTAEPTVDFERALAADNPTGEDGDEHSDDETDDGREKDEKNRFCPAAKNEGLEADVSDRGPPVAAHERVRGTRGQTEDEGNSVPGDGAEEASEEDFLVHHFDVEHALADGLGDGGVEKAGGHEIR